MPQIIIDLPDDDFKLLEKATELHNQWCKKQADRLECIPEKKSLVEVLRNGATVESYVHSVILSAARREVESND